MVLTSPFFLCLIVCFFLFIHIFIIMKNVTNEEIWAVPPYYRGIEVSTLGNVRDSKTKKLRKTKTLLNGHPAIACWRWEKNGKTYYNTWYLSTIVYLTFNPNPEALLLKRFKLKHLDGDVHNCKRDNLEWVKWSYTKVAVDKRKKTKGQTDDNIFKLNKFINNLT